MKSNRVRRGGTCLVCVPLILASCIVRPEKEDQGALAAGYVIGLTAQSLGYTQVKRNNGLTRGSTNTSIVIYSTLVEAIGTDVPTYQNSPTLGDSFVVTRAGIYSVTVDSQAGAAHSMSIRIGSAALINNIDVDRKVGMTTGGTMGSIKWDGKVSQGEMISVFDDGTAANAANNSILIALIRGL